MIRSLSLADILGTEFNINFIIYAEDSRALGLIKIRGYNLVLLDKLSDIGSSSTILTLLQDKVDILVFDFYEITSDYQLSFKKENYKVVCIDDYHNIHFYADVVINVSNSVHKNDYSCESYTQLLLGTEYIMMRKTFLQNSLLPCRSVKDISSVFLNMGGSDSPNNTLKFLKAVSQIRSLNEIHIVVGVLYEHKESLQNYLKNNQGHPATFLYHNMNDKELNEILSKCQVAICPASGISMEISTIGFGMLSGYTADNQKNLLTGLIKRECAINGNDFNLLSEADITLALQAMIADPKGTNRMIQNQRKLIDGKSPERIRKVFRSL